MFLRLLKRDNLSNAIHAPTVQTHVNALLPKVARSCAQHSDMRCVHKRKSTLGQRHKMLMHYIPKCTTVYDASPLQMILLKHWKQSKSAHTRNINFTRITVPIQSEVPSFTLMRWWLVFWWSNKLVMLETAVVITMSILTVNRWCQVVRTTMKVILAAHTT